MERVFETQIDSNGHVLLPAEVRERHHFTNGARVTVTERGDEVVITSSEKRPYRSMSDMAGFLGTDPKALRTLIEERRMDREKEDRPFGS